MLVLCRLRCIELIRHTRVNGVVRYWRVPETRVPYCAVDAYAYSYTWARVFVSKRVNNEPAPQEEGEREGVRTYQ